MIGASAAFGGLAARGFAAAAWRGRLRTVMHWPFCNVVPALQTGEQKSFDFRPSASRNPGVGSEGMRLRSRTENAFRACWASLEPQSAEVGPCNT